MKHLLKKTASFGLILTALLTAVPQAAAQPLGADPTIRKLGNTKSYEPGGAYHLFGGARGSVKKRSGSIGITSRSTVRAGNIETEHIGFGGHYGYETHFHGHGWHEHGPFDNSAIRNGNGKGASAGNGYGATHYVYSISARRVHPADGYDGEQGGGFPEPAGARDIYSYAVSGNASRSRIIQPEKACRNGSVCPFSEKSPAKENHQDWHRTNGKSESGNAVADAVRNAYAGNNPSASYGNVPTSPDLAEVTRGITQVRKFQEEYDVFGGRKTSFTAEELAAFGRQESSPLGTTVFNGGMVTPKIPEPFANAVREGSKELWDYETKEGRAFRDGMNKAADRAIAPFDPNLSTGANIANKFGAVAKGGANIVTYGYTASGIGHAFAWITPEPLANGIHNSASAARGKLNDWAGSDPDRQAYAKSATEIAEFGINFVPPKPGKGGFGRVRGKPHIEAPHTPGRNGHGHSDGIRNRESHPHAGGSSPNRRDGHNGKHRSDSDSLTAGNNGRNGHNGSSAHNGGSGGKNPPPHNNGNGGSNFGGHSGGNGGGGNHNGGGKGNVHNGGSSGNHGNNKGSRQPETGNHHKPDTSKPDKTDLAENHKTCSFHGSTLVKTNTGYKAIADIRIGDQVLAKNEYNGETAYKAVTAQYRNPYAQTVYIRISDTNGKTQTLIANTIHPFFANGKWTAAGSLKAGDVLLDENGAAQTVQSVETKAEELTAYNLTVADFHTYFVKGAERGTDAVWVHNACDPADRPSSSRTPYPDNTPVNIKDKDGNPTGETLVYRSNEKHTPGAAGKKGGEKAGIEPRNSAEIFEQSVPSTKKDRVRYAMDEHGNMHEFKYSNDGTWHWAKSSADAESALTKNKVPSDVLDYFGISKKGSKWK